MVTVGTKFASTAIVNDISKQMVRIYNKDFETNPLQKLTFYFMYPIIKLGFFTCPHETRKKKIFQYVFFIIFVIFSVFLKILY